MEFNAAVTRAVAVGTRYCRQFYAQRYLLSVSAKIEKIYDSVFISSCLINYYKPPS